MSVDDEEYERRLVMVERDYHAALRREHRREIIDVLAGWAMLGYFLVWLTPTSVLGAIALIGWFGVCIVRQRDLRAKRRELDALPELTLPPARLR